MFNQAFILAVLMLGHAGRSESVKTVSTELAELSAESGIKMIASPALGKQLIFVAKHGRSPESVLSYIATALHASVVRNSVGLNLVRTERDVQIFNEQRTKERSEWLRKRIDSVEGYRLAHGVGAGTTSTSELFAQIIHEGNTAQLLSRGNAETPEPHYATELLPNEPLILDMIKKIGLSRIAALGSEQAGPSTMVLENAPSVWKATTIPGFKEELNTFYSEYDKVPQQTIPQQVVSLIPVLGMTPFFEGWGTNRSRPEKLRLMVRSEPGLITFYLQGYDGEGREVLFSYEHAGPTAVLRFPTTIAAPYFIRNDSHWTQGSDIAERALKFRQITSLEEVPEWFKRPDKIEPMNVFVADALMKLSELEPNQCFVVDVSDSLWTDVATAIHNRQINLDAIKALMIEWSLYEEVKGSEGTVWRPRELLDGSSSTANRKALGEFARSCLTGQSVELRSVARFALDAGTDQTALINLWMPKLQSSPILAQNSGHAEYKFYRLLGAIPNTLWESLLQGQPASVSELGVGDKFEELLEQDLEKPVGNGPIPDIYQHSAELYDQLSPGQEPVKFVHPQQDELVGIVDKNRDEIKWGSLKSLDAFGILPVRRHPTPQIAITRQEFERRMEEAGTKICFGKSRKLVILLGLPKSLYFRLDVDAKPVPTTEFTAYQDLSESEKADIWKRMVETRLDRATHPIISYQGGVRAPQAKP